MAAPQITALPLPPSRSDSPSNFTAKADALLGSLPGFVAEANAQAAYTDTAAAEAGNSAAEAAASAAEAAGSAEAAAITVGAINNRRYATKALMNADLLPINGVVSIVTDDAIAANNGWYYKLGASGTGSWEWLPDQPAKTSDVDDARQLAAIDSRAARSVATVRKRPRGPGHQDGLVVGLGGIQAHLAAIRKIPRPQGGYADNFFLTLGKTPIPSVRMKNRPRSRLYASALVLVCGLSVVGVVESTEERIRGIESDIAAVNARIDLDGEGRSEPVAQSVQNPTWLAESVVVGGESQIMVHDGTAYRQITPAGSNWRAPVVSTLNIVRALRDNGGVYPYSLLPNGLQLRESSALLHKVVTGQSLSVGSHGVVLTDEANSDFPFYDGYARLFTKSVPPEYQDYCLSLSGGPRPSGWSSSTAFVPIHEYFDTASKRGETIASSWSVAFRKWSVRNTHIDPRLLVTISGNGGKAYVDLKKGTQVYTDLISHVSKANEIAISMGLTHIVHSIALIHGESQIGTTQAEYEVIMDEWVSDIQADTMAITGQTVAPIAFLSQMLTGEAGTIPAIPLAQLKASEDNPHISMIGPKYQFPYYDTYHMLAEGYVKLGELEARAERFWMGGQKWQPLKPVSVEIVNNVITITYNNLPGGNYETPGPVGKLEIDRETITDPGSAGFAVSGVDIINVELGDDGRSVILTLSAIPAVGATLSYALQEDLDSPHQGNGRRGNIRDSDCRDQSRYDNAFLYNWSVAFSHAIEL